MIKNELRKVASALGIEKIGALKDNDMTVVVALFPYYVANEQGNVAMYARARDYHKVNAEKLEVICEFLRDNGARTCKIFVDNAARNDRKAAQLAGLGFYGRNNMLICDEYGSYFTIGQIVTDLEIEPDKPDSGKCENCGECVRACPSGALNGGEYQKSLCLSEISQKKGELTVSEAELLKLAGTVWGCDICQSACPHNANLTTNVPRELMENRVVNLALCDIADMDDNEFRQEYEQYAFSWRGVDTLKRNLKILQKCNK
ncbi:MAG: DUF1730 domain-containing protein [Oscillospiraceae bacterium]|nr:DUF1730 domain-containing protein [Oscillospiraceae bacterium]